MVPDGDRWAAGPPEDVEVHPCLGLCLKEHLNEVCCGHVVICQIASWENRDAGVVRKLTFVDGKGVRLSRPGRSDKVILELLGEGALSREEIMEQTGFAKSTVSRKLSALKAEGLVERVGLQDIWRIKPCRTH